MASSTVGIIPHVDPELDLAQSFPDLKWRFVVGDYRIQENPNLAVLEVLDEDGRTKLHEGTVPNTFEKRKAFLKILAAKTRAFQQEPTDPNDATAIAVKKANKEKYTKTLEEFLGSDGVKAYQAALEEEYRSVAFRDAVFVKSTDSITGPKWQQSPVGWIGGPSGGGKSFIREKFIEEIQSRSYVAADKSEMTDNYFVSVDGGIEREVSQIRSLTLEAILQKGWSGISDLHERTEDDVTKPKELIVKNKVKEALVANKTVLGVVIPETFTQYIIPETFTKYIGKRKESELEKEFRQFAKKPNTVLVFAKMTGGEKPADKERYRRTVQVKGDDRAWSGKFDQDHTINRVVTLNQKRDCESKKYDAGWFFRHKFKAGRKMSSHARIIFRQVQASLKHDVISMSILNDLILVVKINRQWVEYRADKPTHKGLEYKEITQRAFDAWNEVCKNTAEDLPQWYEKNKDIHANIKINTFVNGVLQENPKPELKLENNTGRIAADTHTEFKFKLFNNFESRHKHADKIILDASIKTATYFFNKTLHPQSVSYSSVIPKKPIVVPPGIYHVVISKVNFDRRYPAIAQKHNASTAHLSTRANASQARLKPNQIALNFVESKVIKHKHGCYVEQVTDAGEYNITAHRYPPEINKTDIFAKALQRMCNHVIFNSIPYAGAALREICIAFKNKGFDTKSLSDEQSNLLCRLLPPCRNLAEMMPNIERNLMGLYQHATAMKVEATGDYIPSKAYLDYAEKQCLSFRLNQGESEPIRILARAKEDPLLIKAYALVCAAHGWECKNESRYGAANETDLNRVLADPAVLNVVRTTLRIAPPAPPQTPHLNLHI